MALALEALCLLEGSDGQGTVRPGWQASSLTCSFLPPPSSDEEADCGGSEASSAVPWDERPRRQGPRPSPLLKPLAQHSSLRDALPRAISPHGLEEPEAVHGEQRTCLGGTDRRACVILGHGGGRGEGGQGPPWTVFPHGGPRDSRPGPQAQRQWSWDLWGLGYKSG